MGLFVILFSLTFFCSRIFIFFLFELFFYLTFFNVFNENKTPFDFPLSLCSGGKQARLLGGVDHRIVQISSRKNCYLFLQHWTYSILTMYVPTFEYMTLLCTPLEARRAEALPRLGGCISIFELVMVTICNGCVYPPKNSPCQIRIQTFDPPKKKFYPLKI